ncbi:MAG: sigma-54 dependent transcriptional regulator [Pseudomonadota bacterium]
MSDCRAKVLVLHAKAARTADLCARLRFLDYEPVVADRKDPLATVTQFSDVTAVLGDSTVPGFAGTLEKIRQNRPGLPCLSLTAQPAVADVDDVWPLQLPLKRTQLERLLRRAERYCGRERRHLLTGCSKSIRQVRGLIESVADFDTSVLITGPSGTGKELVARTIHELSERADKPFVPVNCGAIPADLLESELFGHKKGAFTGAVSDRAGRFELAEGGTLFLDEIGDMNYDMQVKLLRVIQEQCYQRVGSNQRKRTNVRIVAATHCDLPKAIEDGEFREDLYYRLNVFPIEMPPLRKRVSDLPDLLSDLLLRHSDSDQPRLAVSEAALDALAGYHWPGNIRELSNLVERLLIIKPEGTIDVDDLPMKYRESSRSTSGQQNLVSQAMTMSRANLKEHLEAIEKDLICQAISESDGVVSKAADLLSLRRTTLVEKIKKLDIH